MCTTCTLISMCMCVYYTARVWIPYIRNFYIVTAWVWSMAMCYAYTCNYYEYKSLLYSKKCIKGWVSHRSSITGDNLNVMHGRWLKGWLTIVNYACATGWLIDTNLIQSCGCLQLISCICFIVMWVLATLSNHTGSALNNHNNFAGRFYHGISTNYQAKCFVFNLCDCGGDSCVDSH